MGSHAHKSRVEPQFEGLRPKKLLLKNRYILKKQIEIENKVKIMRQSNWMGQK